jgi:hypothetical protein
MLKPTRMFLIALAHSIGFFYLNVYPIARLHADPLWGSNGFGFTSSYGFPLSVGTSAGCFTGAGYHYGYLVINLLMWNGVAAALFAMPFLLSLTRTIWKASVKSISDAFNYGGLIPPDTFPK